MLGSVLIFTGLILIIVDKIGNIHRFPGDIMIKKDNFVFYFPITTCIIISIFLTILFNLIRKK